MRSIASQLATETKPSVANRPVRISFVITDLDVGGAERALVALATGLNRAHWSPSVICLDKPGALVANLERAQIPTLCLGVNRRKPLHAILRLAKALREQHPEIVQSFLFHANFATRLAALWAGRPIVVGGIRVAEHERRWHLTLDRMTQSLSTGAVCVSQGVLRHSIKQGRISPSRLVVIPNGVDPKPFDETNPFSFSRLLSTRSPDPSNEPRQTKPDRSASPDHPPAASDQTNPLARGEATRATVAHGQFHRTNPFSSTNPYEANPDTTADPKTDATSASAGRFPNEPMIALFVGRLDRQKGVDVLFKALERLVDHPREWHLFLVGDGPERETLESQTSVNPALLARVHWLGRRPDVPALLKGSDLLILPSRWEGMPNVVLEAMASARAVIGTRVEGTEDLVEPNLTGWLVNPDDADQLATAIEEALNDPGRLTKMGLAARERVEARFSPESVVQAYERLWAGLLQIRFDRPSTLMAAEAD